MSSLYQDLVKQHGFSPAQKIIISQVLQGEVLEIGSSSGYMTKEFKKRGSIIDVVEVDNKDIMEAKKFARNVFLGSIEDNKLRQKIKGKYDFIICADVLEHLFDPEAALLFLKSKIKKEGVILISIPNIAYWAMRIQLLKGRFDYTESGLLDKTHLRFYTYNSFLELLKKLEFKIEKIYPAEVSIPFGHILHINFLKLLFAKFFPNLSIYHYVVKAKK